MFSGRSGSALDYGNRYYTHSRFNLAVAMRSVYLLCPMCFHSFFDVQDCVVTIGINVAEICVVKECPMEANLEVTPRCEPLTIGPRAVMPVFFQVTNKDR